MTNYFGLWFLTNFFNDLVFRKLLKTILRYKVNYESRYLVNIQSSNQLKLYLYGSVKISVVTFNFRDLMFFSNELNLKINFEIKNVSYFFNFKFTMSI